MRKRLGVVRGGPSREYEVSLKSGKAIIDHANKDKYEIVDILIDKNGHWHFRGTKTEPHKIFPHVDFVWIALHGHYGEDGKIQNILDHHGIPYNGGDSLSSAMAMHKAISHNNFRKAGIRIPWHTTLKKNDYNSDSVLEIFRSTPMPLIIKPVADGSSFDVYVAKDILSLEQALNKIFLNTDEAILEEKINGVEATCGVIENFRGQSIYALPPIEIIPHNKEIFDFDAKYNGQSDEICPGRFSDEIKKTIEKYAIEAHRALGLRHYSRSDFMISKNGNVYIIEINSLPGTTPTSLIPKALEAVGIKLTDFIDHIISISSKS